MGKTVRRDFFRLTGVTMSGVRLSAFRHNKLRWSWSSLPVVSSDVDVDLGDCCAEEHFLVVATKLATEDVHVELEIDVLRSFDWQQQLNHRLVVAHLSIITIARHSHRSTFLQLSPSNT